MYLISRDAEARRERAGLQHPHHRLIDTARDTQEDRRHREGETIRTHSGKTWETAEAKKVPLLKGWLPDVPAG